MHATQVEYAAAKATFDTIAATRATIPRANDDEYWNAYDALLTAELAMVEWARGVIETDPKYGPRYAKVKPVFEKGMKHHSLRPKLIDICFHLAA